MAREPAREVGEVKGWRRDGISECSRRKVIDAVSAMVCLADVADAGHCFTIAPEARNRLIDVNPLSVAEANRECAVVAFS